MCALARGRAALALEASSPVDPSFWVIHPTIERLWQFKKLYFPFVSEVWPLAGTSQIDRCHGHGRNGTIPFRVALANDTAQEAYTNAELYGAMAPDPTRGDDGRDAAAVTTLAMPYLYETFEWDHCMEMGYDFYDGDDAA